MQKSTAKFFLSWLAFHFSVIESRDCKIQVNRQKDCDLRLKQVKILFSVIQQVTYRKYHSS